MGRLVILPSWWCWGACTLHSLICFIWVVRSSWLVMSLRIFWSASLKMWWSISLSWLYTNCHSTDYSILEHSDDLKFLFKVCNNEIDSIDIFGNIDVHVLDRIIRSEKTFFLRPCTFDDLCRAPFHRKTQR